MKNDIGWSRLLKAIRAERTFIERRKTIAFMIGVVILVFVLLVGFLRVQLMNVKVPVIVEMATPTITVTPNPTVTRTPIATPAPTLASTLASPDLGNQIPEAVDDRNAYNGYFWYGEGWVPGLPTFETQFLRMPDVSTGSAVFYAPDAMEAQVEYRGLFVDGMVGAVAVPFCSEIGHSVWLQRPGRDWEGPFLVADCTRRNDLYGVIEFRDQVVEVDFNTAVAWGMARYGGAQNGGRWSALTGRMDAVLLSKIIPEQWDGVIIDLSVWTLQNIRYAEITENRYQVQNYKPPQKEGGLPSWLLNGTWTVFK
jgi:hypothetical protein